MIDLSRYLINGEYPDLPVRVPRAPRLRLAGDIDIRGMETPFAPEPYIPNINPRVPKLENVAEALARRQPGTPIQPRPIRPPSPPATPNNLGSGMNRNMNRRSAL